MATTAEAAPGAPYPLRFDIDYPEGLSRWLIFVKWLLAFPHFLIIYALLAVASVIQFIAFFAILFTKRYPRGLFDFVVNIYRWNANVSAYVGFLRDDYPPFSWDPGKYPVTFEVDYPEQLSRWLIFFKWLLAFPHYIVLGLVYIVAMLLWFLAFFAILFTGRFPRGMFDFIVGTLRWSYRVQAYTYLLTDQYPPFSTK